MSKIEKNCPLRIENLEPYFIWQFGINLPNNLKPKSTTFKDLNLSEEDLLNPEVFTTNYKILNEINNAGSELYSNCNLKCIRECPVNYCRRESRLENDIERLAKQPINFLDFNYYWETEAKVLWLSNKSGKDKKITGLTVEGLQSFEENLYQIGMQSTSSKEYFRYISTSKKRRVNIRLILFNQHQRIQNLGNKNELGDFFIRFNEFEKLIEGSFESMTFHLDLYGSRFFELKTIEGIEIKDENFGFDVDFDNWIDKI